MEREIRTKQGEVENMSKSSFTLYRGIPHYVRKGSNGRQGAQHFGLGCLKYRKLPRALQDLLRLQSYKERAKIEPESDAHLHSKQDHIFPKPFSSSPPSSKSTKC
jgi:hypothetical protein